MKVEITDAAKQFITLADEPIVRKIIEEMTEENTNENIEIAMHALECNNIRVLESSAEIAKNNRIRDQFGDGSKDYDVWIEATVDAGYDGFYKIGVYLTDIWQIDSENHEEIANRMYVRRYIETYTILRKNNI